MATVTNRNWKYLSLFQCSALDYIFVRTSIGYCKKLKPKNVRRREDLRTHRAETSIRI